MLQKEFILSYYKERPNEAIRHAEVVDWATKVWEEQTGRKFRDPDRAIRSLHQKGMLVKIGKGVYKYDPNAVNSPQLEDFSPEQRRAILERDGHRCVICGRGRKDGMELHVDHIKPKDLGGKATLANGQVLCGMHNYRKKTHKQTETGKRMFIALHRQAQESGDSQMANFCEAVLAVYDGHGINDHIKWGKS